ILDNGAKIDATEGGFTALHVAGDHGSAEVTRLLLKHGADINALDTAGDTPLVHSIFQRRSDVVEVLLVHGADVNLGLVYPLTLACGRDDIELVKALLKRGADVNHRDEWCRGATPLIAAATAGNPGMVDL